MEDRNTQIDEEPWRDIFTDWDFFLTTGSEVHCSLLCVLEAPGKAPYSRFVLKLGFLIVHIDRELIVLELQAGLTLSRPPTPTSSLPRTLTGAISLTI